MTDHVANRRLIIDALRRELVGPAPAGATIDLGNTIVLDDPALLYRSYRQLGSGEEILTRDSPIKRYGVGVLFPPGAPKDETDAASDDAASGDPPPAVEIPIEAGIPEVPEEIRTGGERDTDDLDLSLANAYQPSSLGISFLAELPEGATLVVEAMGGRYRRVEARARPSEGKPWSRDWWPRQPVALQAAFPAADLLAPRSRRLVAATGSRGTHALAATTNLEGLDPRIEVFSRPREDRQSLLTVCLVNRTPTPGRGAPHEACLFQTAFHATVISPHGTHHILPYPGPAVEGDEEQEGLALLYRQAQTFATGHGCAADWAVAGGTGRARSVSAECLPVVETPNITPDITREDGSRLMVSMAALAGLTPGNDGRVALREVVERYEAWIERQRVIAEGPTLDDQYRAAARRHLERCTRAAARMREGLAYIETDSRARLAFQLANHAILLQQLVGLNPPRAVRYDSGANRLVIAGTYTVPDPLRPPEGRGEWRPFQIAFLLASLRSSADGLAPDRETVELIWFPTGGGKTEAYLGLAAFSLFKRRLDDPMDAGVHVLMRYTLRLLTTQQFQRASGLICAMEYLRRDRARALGITPFSIGIWLGGETTPNSRETAVKALSQIEGSRSANNPFLLGRCPWCGAEFGRVEGPARAGGRGRRARVLTPGYARCQPPGQSEPTVCFQCPDSGCPFSDGLPIHVIDDDIYDHRPSLVIGTIDKFAMLTWNPRARALFGLAADGNRLASPPGLIIQDELHLIAGPLGSLAGLYETTIEELCTDRRGPIPIRPKIVSSTATIRRYPDQIQGLYARREVALFPPPGLEVGDSFFARYERERPGRIYVGIHAASLGSVQTEWVRALTALLQAPMPLDSAGRDPWWTLLIFFNSIREMGTAHTLLQSDIPDYARVIWEREGTAREERRYPRLVRELTGGLRSDEITGAIAELEVRTTDGRRPPVDVCLASNIIEVGIDIPRLSLMVVAGQPKTTSQYIQVTGRVGRLRDQPGLIITLYSPSKPRDRSHFERFRAYHEQLYAHVEPTSVTPFSPPALDRALHAVLVAYARQQGDQALASRPLPYPEAMVERFRQLILDRVEAVDPSERGAVERVLARRAREWRDWKRPRWEGAGEDVPLLRRAGAYATAEAIQLSWATLTSMRNVDAECEAEITTRYLTEESNDDA